jgi:hypothetical protein
MHARSANLGDTIAVGALICDALPASRSSAYDRGDFPLDEREIGRDVVVGPLAAGHLVWVLETGDQIAGLALARRRLLQRASHVADLTLLVHPLARGRGGGLTLLAAIEHAATTSPLIHKLAALVASDDDALKATLLAANSGWCRERIVVQGMRRGAATVDSELWGRVVGAGPSPS